MIKYTNLLNLILNLCLKSSNLQLIYKRKGKLKASPNLIIFNLILIVFLFKL